VTPMEPGPLGRFIGVDLGEPQVTPVEKWNVYTYDRRIAMDLTNFNLHCVERGSRDSALDKHLYDRCLEAGVTFEFGRPLVSQGDFSRLPPDSIIATGLYFEAFEAFHIPYQKVFGYIGRGKTDKKADCAVWFHDFILDYAYYGASNGVVFVLYFAREPVRENEWEEFKERQLDGQEGISCASWDYHEGLVPTGAPDNPRLFVGDKILAGTVSGMMDPFALFGVHGSLVSGKIAAIAHKDKRQAYELFKRYVRFFRRNLFLKKVFDGMPVGFKKSTLPAQLQFAQDHADLVKGPLDGFLKALPGYKQLPY
jgi:hypothetical protein